jgi:FkbM family methyltransferase
MTFISHAQNFEDIMLWRALRDVRDGFYIDVGAGSPDEHSVTRAFYDRGWHGVNIEPGAGDFQNLLQSRARDINLNIALGDTARRGQFFHVPGTGLSTLETASLPGIRQAGYAPHADEIDILTLAEICRQHAAPVIHFLKIDVEGGEAAVLAGADFKTYRPWIVLCEATAPMSAVLTHAAWEPILLSANYHFVWFDGLNRFYIAAEKFQALRGHFQTPPNVFDDFIRADGTGIAQRITTAEARAETAIAETLQHRAALEAAQHDLAATRAAHAALQKKAREEGNSQQAALRAERLASQTKSIEIAALKAMLGAIHASSSWRLTAPLRAIKNLLRPARPLSPEHQEPS